MNDNSLKNACADIITATILTLADIFEAKGKPRNKALLMAADVISASSGKIARELIN